MTLWLVLMARVASTVFVGTTVCVGKRTGVEGVGTISPEQDTEENSNAENENQVTEPDRVFVEEFFHGYLH